MGVLFTVLANIPLLRSGRDAYIPPVSLHQGALAAVPGLSHFEAACVACLESTKDINFSFGSNSSRISPQLVQYLISRGYPSVTVLSQQLLAATVSSTPITVPGGNSTDVYTCASASSSSGAQAPISRPS